mmetsp:Transcript_10281/g.22312  ORF Transcript_10281/g.22312 Transcript_10281/m.22312 type:complete len:83 (-) Transcript_10281:553-801(-)
MRSSSMKSVVLHLTDCSPLRQALPRSTQPWYTHRRSIRDGECGAQYRAHASPCLLAFAASSRARMSSLCLARSHATARRFTQ